MIHSAFRSLFRRPARPLARRAAVRLRMEALEDRATPATLYVDDSFTASQLSATRFNSIQAAVTAAHTHDNIVVLPGTYTETVTINKSDVDLFAAGLPGQVKIVAPSATTDIVVQVAGGAKDVDIVGFTITGGNAGIQFGTHFNSPASASGSGSARFDTVSGYNQVGIEAIGTGSKVEIENNAVFNPSSTAVGPIGIQVSDGATGEVEGNLVSGNKGGAAGPEGDGILIFQTSNVTVERNVTFNNDEGILLASFDSTHPVTNVTVRGNKSFSNTFNGIGLAGANNNKVFDNEVYLNGFDGINVGNDPTNGFEGAATGNVIQGNTAKLNGRAGIFLEANATGNRVTGNRLFGNNTNNVTGGADAVDLSTGAGTAGTANTWTGNTGATSIPVGLVRGNNGHGHDHDHDHDHDDDHDHGHHGHRFHHWD